MRVLVATAAVLCLAGCASSGTAPVGTTGAPSRPFAAPFAKEGLVESTGRADFGSGAGGESVQFIPRASFGVGIALLNASHSRVVVTGVRVVEPRGTQVHQIGTRLVLWTPPTCPPGAMCPFHGFGLRPFDATPQPVAIGPGELLGVALGFRLGSCSAGHLASRAAPSRAVIAFHLPAGKERHQDFSLGSARLPLASGSRRCELR